MDILSEYINIDHTRCDFNIVKDLPRAKHKRAKCPYVRKHELFALF